MTTEHGVPTLQGEHDLSTAPGIRDELERVFDAGSAVVVDLSAVTFMDSSVLNAILYGSDRAQQHEAHRFAVAFRPVRARPAGSSSSTGVDRVLAIHPDRGSAVAAISGGGS